MFCASRWDSKIINPRVSSGVFALPACSVRQMACLHRLASVLPVGAAEHHLLDTFSETVDCLGERVIFCKLGLACALTENGALHAVMSIYARVPILFLRSRFLRDFHFGRATTENITMIRCYGCVTHTFSPFKRKILNECTSNNY